MDSETVADAGLTDTGVELGFLEEVEEPWKMHRCFFPSKVGGKPAWLNPKDLYPSDGLTCPSCGKQMSFLLQIYTPDQDDENAFHRTIFLFCCKTRNCHKNNSNECFKVLRCQLRKENKYYDSEPPIYDCSTFHQSVTEFDNTCKVCGCLGTKVCSRCSSVRYCSKEHQTLHWKTHKLVCNKTCNAENANILDGNSHILFPEKEIIIEEEELAKSEEENPQQHHCRQTGSENSAEEKSLSPAELEQFANAGDSQFLHFRQSISDYPDQVIRYSKGGTPLWCSSENMISSDDVPKCCCGSARQLEFQVMPQLLNHIGVETLLDEPSIDWGVLVIFTCVLNCVPTNCAYVEEYLHKQDFSQT